MKRLKKRIKRTPITFIINLSFLRNYNFNSTLSLSLSLHLECWSIHRRRSSLLLLLLSSLKLRNRETGAERERRQEQSSPRNNRLIQPKSGNCKSTRGFWWVSLNFPESRDKILNFPHKMFWFGCDCFYWSRGFSELDSEPSEPKPFSLPSPLPRWPQGTKRTFLFWKLQFIYGCKISFIALNFCSNFGKFYKSFFFLQLKFRSY